MTLQRPSVTGLRTALAFYGPMCTKKTTGNRTGTLHNGNMTKLREMAFRKEEFFMSGVGGIFVHHPEEGQAARITQIRHRIGAI